MPSDMVGKHIINSVGLQRPCFLQRPCLYICKMINPHSLNCCEVRSGFWELAVKYCL